MGEGFESWREGDNLVAMTHPDVLLWGQALENVRRVVNVDGRGTVLPFVCFLDSAAKDLSHELVAVADSEYWRALREDFGVDCG